MSDIADAILFAVAEAGLALPEPLLVINDFQGALKATYPGANFWSPELESLAPVALYKAIILFSPKQKDETNYLIAESLKKLSAGGVFICAASNEAGGKTLSKQLAAFNIVTTDTSKHKCRVVRTNESQKADPVLIEQAIARGTIQKREDGLWTRPGVFSWDRLDKGTSILLKHLPVSLKGKGADFGCGIGTIGLELLQRFEDIEKLTCIDRDIRALSCCDHNLADFNNRFSTLQADLTKAIDIANLDFIVMNPPFHTGKQQSIAMGQAFITNAAKCLKKEGMLIFVANSHLPYESTLTENFASHRILNEEHGFKIIEAVK